MSPNKTLYVRDEDAPLWERAEKAAQKARQSVSAIVTSALSAHLATIERGETADVADRIQLYPTQLRLITREMTEDPNFDPDRVISGPEPGPLLQWGPYGWNLYYEKPSGDPDDYLVCDRDAPTESAVAWAREHLDTVYRNTGRVTVDMRDDNGRQWTEGFRGRWLVEPSDDNRGTEDAGACYGIAATAKGRIAVYCYHVNGRFAPVLNDYDDLDEASAEDHDLPDELISQAAAELGEKRVVWRDI